MRYCAVFAGKFNADLMRVTNNKINRKQKTSTGRRI